MSFNTVFASAVNVIFSAVPQTLLIELNTEHSSNTVSQPLQAQKHCCKCSCLFLAQ